MHSFSWKHTTREEFDKAVELLILEKYKRDEPGLIASAVEGRGGDGGIDIDIRVRKTGQLVRIYQLKHFPEGISGTYRKTRLTQVERSFNSALQHSPPKWILVMPAKFTNQVKKSITKMARGTGVSVGFTDITELELLLARFPEIRSHLEASALREALATVGRDSAALNRPDDLAEEVRRLANRVDGMSAYWGRSFGVLPDGTQFESLHAKRPDAAEREPLSVQLTLDFSKHPDASAAWDKASRYGTFEPVILPPEVVTKLERIGPEWFASTKSNIAIEMHPTPGQHVTKPVKLSTLTAPGQGRKATARGTVTGEAGGFEGTQLQLSFPGGLSVNLLLPDDRTQAVAADLAFDYADKAVGDVHSAARLLAAMQDCAGLSIELEDVTIRLGPPEKSETLNTQAVIELADDLLELERMKGVSFLFPSSLASTRDRIRARVLRGILEGKVHYVPFLDSITAISSGENTEQLKRCLREDGSIYVMNPFTSVELYGETIELDEVSYFHPAIRAMNHAEHLKAILAGDVVGREIEFRPIDPADGFRIYVPSKLKSKDIQPWNIPGVLEYEEALSPLQAASGR